MTGTSVLHQSLLLTKPEEPPKGPELNLTLKEQECLSILKRCKNLEELKKVHAHVLKWGFFWSPFCASNLLATCAISHRGSMDYACSIFRQIDEPGAFDFNALIRGFVKDVKFEEALVFYNEMFERGVEPDNFTFPALFKACARLQALKEGMQIHGHVF